MIRATLNINGSNLTSFIKYPLSITDKNLDESLNIYELTLYGTDNAVPYKPNSIATFSLYQDDILYKTYDLVLTSDVVERVGVSSKYHHKLTFLEKTHLLSLDVLPDMTITRIIGVYEPTLKDVAAKILSVAEGQFSNALSIDATTAAILDAIESPELTLTRYTSLEALRLVFGMAKIVPYVQSGTTLKHIAVKTTVATIATSLARTEAYDPSTYRTRLYSTVENFVGGGDTKGSIIEPATGWLSPRSPNNVDIMPDAAIIKTSRPIYKIEDVVIRAKVVYGRLVDGTPLGISIPIEDMPAEWFDELKLNDFLREKSLYDTLPNTDAGKGSSVFYEQGKTDIKGLTSIPETWSSFWAPKKHALSKIFLDILDLNFQVKPAYYAAFIAYAETQWNIKNPGVPSSPMTAGTEHYLAPFGHQFTDIGYEGVRNVPFNKVNWSTLTTTAFDVVASNFRIKYTPYINTKLFTYKERKESEPQYQSTMYYNQSANVVSDDMLAELHDKVSKRGSGTTLTEKLIHTNLNQLIDLGTRVGDYIITAKDYTISATDIPTEYVLSKFYAKLNQYVAVLEKFRQFSIPNENIVDRQYTIQEFVKFSAAKTTKTASIALSSYTGTQEPNLFRISTYGGDDNENYIYYPTNFAFNNALVFEVQFPTQAVSGGQSIAHPNDTDGTRRMEQLLRYTDSRGRFDTATFSYGTNFTGTTTLQDSFDLPVSTDAFATTHATFTNKTIDKDARERLSISYIIHHIDESGKVYINRGWAKRNGLIGGAGLTGLRYQWTFGKPYGTSEKVSTYGATGSASAATFTVDGTSLRLNPPANPGGGVAWSIIDEDNNILFWVDETTATPLYLNFRSTY